MRGRFRPYGKEFDVNYLLRKHAALASGVTLATNLAIFAMAAVATSTSVLGASQDRYFETPQFAFIDTRRTDVTAHIVWAAGDAAVEEEVILSNDADMAPVQTQGTMLPPGQILSTGRVVRIDSEAGQIVIEHKPIAYLYMEAMTMIFRVKDLVMLTAMTPGDKVRFKVERGDDGYVITKIEHTN